MGKAYDLKRNREQVQEIKQNIESKKEESQKLEKQKEELMDAMTEVSGADLDQEVIDTVRDSINSALDANSEKGRELSDEMNEDIKSLETIKQDTMDSLEDAQKQKEGISKKQKILEAFNMEGYLDNASQKLDTNIQELNELKDEVMEAMKESMDEAAKLSGL